MARKKLERVRVTDSFNTKAFLEPSNGLDGVMYLVSDATKEYVAELLSEIKWKAYVRNPQIAAAVSMETKKNIAAHNTPMPEVQEGEGVLYVVPTSELTEDELPELRWYFIVLAYAQEKTNTDVEELLEALTGASTCECEACKYALKCFQSGIEA